MRLDKDLYLMFILVYSKADKVTGTMENVSNEEKTLLLYSCPHGPSCVMGDVESKS